MEYGVRGVVWSELFFFFKQKTAYEMRISDWSSDVCSSDLHRMLSSKIVPGSGRGHRPADRQCDRRPYAATACRHLAAAGICRFRDTLEPFFQKHVDLDPCEMRSDATMHARAKDEEIGRAHV